MSFVEFLILFYENIWWFVIPIALVFVFVERWLYTVRVWYFLDIEWTLLEVKVPADVAKTPKAMEQIFADLHSIYSSGTWGDKYLRGRVPQWLIFEMVAHNGIITFYVRTPTKLRNLVEAKIYAQYPKAEIHSVEDYLVRLPRVVPNREYECYGTELVLVREYYPVRTYIEFESTVEEYRLDPISHFSELASKLGRDEYIGLQFFIEPAFGIAEKIRALVDQILGRSASKKEPDFLSEAMEYLMNLLRGAFAPPQWTEKKKPEDAQQISKIMMFSPGERSDLEALEKRAAKLFFKTGIRWIYVSKRDQFQRAMPSATYGFFRLFDNPRTNAFDDNDDVRTRVKGAFSRRREFIRKRNLYYNYVNRILPVKKSFLNTEELATLFHFPSMMVESPGLRSVQAKKGSPPPELPVVY